MGLFDKKFCDICGEKIGLFGNRKLEDGNLCKNCAAKLSPWFEERRHSSVEEIRSQLQYREENRSKVAQFHITREFGKFWRVLIDEEHRWFMVTTATDLLEANPDVIEAAQLTGCNLDIKESRTEIKREGPDGKEVSYNPPRFEYSYDFHIKMTVNSPYFDDIRFRLNNTDVEMMTEAPRGLNALRSFDPSYNIEYRQYKQMGDDICAALNALNKQSAEQSAAPQAAQPDNGPWICPSCGAQNSDNFCQFCGTPRTR